MKIGAMYPSNYLKAADCEPDRTLTIKEVSIHTFKARDGSEEPKPLIVFENEPKGLILNKTNSKLIAKALKSDETDDWVGKAITLYSTEVEFAGDIVDSIRVRSKAPGVKETTAAVDTFGDEDIPF